MNYKIAICDDCESDTQYLSALAAKWAEKSGNTITAKAFPSAEAFLFCYEEENDFDILLLDIEMGGQNGIELAKKIRQGNETVQIVFITGYPDFIAEGYEVAALHYLMKPVAAEKLCSVLDKAANHLAKTEKRVKITFDREIDFVPLDEIIYVEAQKQYVIIHTLGRVYRMKDSLTGMAGRLDERFFKCQRSFLVNLSYVVRVKSNAIILKTGAEIPISRGKAEDIGKAIIRLF